MEHTAFVEQGEEPAYQKHFFVHIGNSLSYTDPLLEVRITEEESNVDVVIDYLNMSHVDMRKCGRRKSNASTLH
jgi:hypothetical protein